MDFLLHLFHSVVVPFSAGCALFFKFSFPEIIKALSSFSFVLLVFIILFRSRISEILIALTGKIKKLTVKKAPDGTIIWEDKEPETPDRPEEDISTQRQNIEPENQSIDTPTTTTDITPAQSPTEELIYRATTGNVEAQVELALAYYEGLHGFTKDREKEYFWWRKAAESHHPRAQSALGVKCFLDEKYDEAVTWFKLSADQDYEKGLFWLGHAYSKGKGVPQNYAEAISLWRRAAAQGNVRAITSIGLAYSNGWGGETDPKEALVWWHKAVEQNDFVAMGNIGWSYYYGRGVKKDYKTALEWFRKAAALGSAYSQNRIGWMYYRGKGIEKDKTLAFKWWLKAASRGYAASQERIASCYLKGEGIEQDYKLAYMWANLSAAQNNESAALLREQVSGLLTPEQIDSAQEMTRNWMPTE